MKVGIIKSLLFAGICGIITVSAVFSATLFSNYGQIQNVQNYSSNPFWTPGSPYNQRLPQAVYAQGADLDAGDCMNVVQPLVAAQCAARDNCKDVALSDIRPTIMVQLSNLPNKNYVSACAGYIDSAYESYVNQYGNALPNKQIAFPTATKTNPDLNKGSGVQIQNPYKQQVPKYKQEILERSQELQQLQQQNGAGSEKLSATAFPTTFNDLSLSERLAFKSADYEQYKNLKAFKTLDVKRAYEWCAEGENKDSPECWDWRCGEDGKDKNKSECITYRCRNKTYKAAHKQECEMNEKCSSGNEKSDECMKYRCYNTADKDLQECKAWKCKNDASFRTANEPMCLDFECDISNLASASDQCKKRLCGDCEADPKGTHASSTACIEYMCQTCPAFETVHLTQCNVVGTDCVSSNPNATSAKYDANGECKIEDCKTGYRPDSDKEHCVPTGDCDDEAKRVAHAIKGSYDANGECKITDCESGYEPNADGTECQELTVYYDLRIYTVDQMPMNIVGLNPTIYVTDDSDSNLCYSVCGTHFGEDDVNTKVLKGLLGRNFCVPEGTSNLFNTFVLVNVKKNDEKIKFSEQQKNKIVTALQQQVADKDKCNWLVRDIVAEIWKHDGSSETQTDRILLHKGLLNLWN